MEIASVLFVVISGAVLASSAGRILFGWRNEVVALATSTVLFGVGGLSLVVFTRLGLRGVVLSFILSILLAFTFVKFNNLECSTDSNNKNIFGCMYWIALLVVFSVSGLKSWAVAENINNMYSITNDIKTFYYVFSLSILMGGISILMFIRECKLVKFMNQSGCSANK